VLDIHKSDEETRKLYRIFVNSGPTYSSSYFEHVSEMLSHCHFSCFMPTTLT
jgi:hypothetical protein